jgi:hypothetical protein
MCSLRCGPARRRDARHAGLRPYLRRSTLPPCPLVECHRRGSKGEQDRHGHLGLGTGLPGEVAPSRERLGIDGPAPSRSIRIPEVSQDFQAASARAGAAAVGSGTTRAPDRGAGSSTPGVAMRGAPGAAWARAAESVSSSSGAGVPGSASLPRGCPIAGAGGPPTAPGAPIAAPWQPIVPSRNALPWQKPEASGRVQARRRHLRGSPRRPSGTRE